jgi:pimeloyl-ACP methyl ester carboxylesterase
MTNTPMINDRDLIFFEQRGTRYAIPRLMSFELDSAIRESYRKNLNKDSMVVEGLKHYKKALERRGIDLSGYNTGETVSDIHDLLSTLKIDSINLYGVSYSGGLMLEVLRHDPSKVRSLVLDSPLPNFIPIDEDEPANFNEALDILFRHVEKDSSDQKRYGNLKQRFRQYFTSITGKVFYIPYAGHSVQYTKNELLDVINDNLSDDESRKNVAFIITDMMGGKHFKYVREKMDELFGGNTPDAMRISVYCADQAAYHSEAILHELSGPYPYMAGYHINDVYKKMCDCWNVPPVKPVTKQAFYSTTPALLADGEMDPACRPLYIDRIHHYLPNSQRFLFLNRGHGVGGKDMDMLFTEFLDNPYRKIGSPNATVKAY